MDRHIFKHENYSTILLLKLVAYLMKKDDLFSKEKDKCGRSYFSPTCIIHSHEMVQRGC